MNRNHILLAISTLIFAGCSTYKQAQTPDDVYYSPGASQEQYVAGTANNSQGDYYSTPNDNYVRMKTQDPARWSYFDEYNTDYYGGYGAMAFSPYGYGYGMGYGMGFGYGAYGFGISPWIGFSYWSPISFWNSYYTWNGCYNPYYGGVIVVNPKTGYNYSTGLTTFNPSSYTNNTYNRYNTRTNSTAFTPYSYSQTIRTNYNNTNTNYFRNTNPARQPFYRSNNANNFNQSSRTYSPPARSSSSFGGSSGGGGGFHSGGGGVSRPGR